MAYVRSLREIPLDEEPHASVLATLLPSLAEGESPGDGEVNWGAASEAQLAHVAMCPVCQAILGGLEGSESPTVGGIQIGGTIDSLESVSGKLWTPGSKDEAFSLLTDAGDDILGEVSDTQLTSSQLSALRARLLKLINAYRARRGRYPATLHSGLNSTAQSWAKNMAINGYRHSNLQAPYRLFSPRRAVAENIGKGFDTAEGVAQGWWKSCAHHYYMVSPHARRVGFGMYQRNGVRYWCYHMAVTRSGLSFYNKCEKCNSCVNWKSGDPYRPGGSRG